ncbi:hypothetical protein BDZ90DRAFT_231160 [Jaminaea rosea]|uniref:Origin recognition complex subunit 5 C-terminal domain-containing protein n=1 Tax=Jaminaea rosea TaxID=1569628 RepID=A0A316UXY5_9BASI|nr:hypothetical protein BDZ90DRAFT_231160 [Jaminaea rosea]PWN29161.1 hypothetical protein BDZ90DRAFT_231160 [Jaminaea rosea]
MSSSLAPLLRPPWPGCLFVYAPSHSHQSRALDDVRQLVRETVNAQPIEIHPNLIGLRAIDVAREIQEAVSSSSSSSTLHQATTSIYPPRASTSSNNESCTILIIPFAHLLRSSHSPLIWSQFLDPPPGYATILISSLTLDRWRTADGIEDATPYRPLVHLSAQRADQKDADREAALLTSLPGGDELQKQWGISAPLAAGLDERPAGKIKSSFLAWSTAALEADIGRDWDVDEVRYLLAPVWIAMTRQVQRGLDEQDDQGGETMASSIADKLKELKAGTPLFSILTPLIRSAVKLLHTRSMGVQAWIQTHSSQPAADSTASVRGRPPLKLSPLASLLLLSSFLASHLPAKHDVRFFLRDETILAASTTSSGGKKRVRRQRKRRPATLGESGETTKTHADPLLLGPRPFTAQRMLYLCQNLCKEFDVRLSGSSLQAQRDVAARRRRKRQRRLGVEDEDEEEKEALNDEAEEVALHSLAVWRTVQALVSAKLLVLVSPPAPAPIVAHKEGGGASSLPALPTRLEWLNQASLRCNCLRDEVKGLVLGSGSSGEEGEGWLDEDEGYEDSDDEEGPLCSKSAAKRDDGGEVFGFNSASRAGWRKRRKEWWTRVEEVGL